MAQEWIVRVEGKEYGPVETDELVEWKREGRLIRENEIRLVGEERWILAGELPEVFADVEPAPPPLPPRALAGAKTWRQILADTFRIYRSGLGRFVLFGLLTSVPMFVLQWTLPKIPFPDLSSGSYTMPSQTLPPISVAMLVVLLFVWPVSAAGFQFVADDILRGQPRSFGAQFSAALRCWGRMLTAALLVYGAYFFWFFVPFAAMLGLVSSGNSLLAVFMILLIGGFMVYMNARLFINFLFWHQTVVLEPNGSLAALRESRELARSVPEAPRARSAALPRRDHRVSLVASPFGADLRTAVAVYAGEICRGSESGGGDGARANNGPGAGAGCADDRGRYRRCCHELTLSAVARRRLRRALLRCQSALGQGRQRRSQPEDLEYFF